MKRLEFWMWVPVIGIMVSHSFITQCLLTWSDRKSFLWLIYQVVSIVTALLTFSYFLSKMKPIWEW